MNHKSVRYYLLSLNLGINSCRLHYAALRFFFSKILKEPFTLEEVPIKKRLKQLPKVISKNDILKMISNTKNLKHKLIIETLYSSGLRLSELQNLKRKNIDFDNNTINVHLGKGKKDRITILSPSLFVDLLKYISKTDFKTSYLFEGRTGKYSKKTIQKVIEKAGKTIGIKATPHMLRHSFATHLLEQGTSIHTIKNLLGHKSVKTTQIYTKTTKLNLKEIPNPLDKR